MPRHECTASVDAAHPGAPVSAFEQTQQLAADLRAAREQPAAEPPRLAAKVGSRVLCVDREEGIRECGTVLAVTPSGGLKVRWDDDGHENWTHDRSPTLYLLPDFSQPDCARCGGEGREVLDAGESSEREVDCWDCVFADAAEPRYDTLPCSRCHGVGTLPERHHERDGECRQDCDDCAGTGCTVERVTGSYELGHGQTEPQLKGEPLPALSALPERLLDWAQHAAEFLRQPAARALFPFADAMRDDLVLLAHAVEHHADHLVEERTARELRDDARDDELVAAVDHARDLETELELERQRVERLQAQLKEALDGAAALSAALKLEHAMREQDAVTRAELVDGHAAELAAERQQNEALRSEVAMLRVDIEALRVAHDLAAGERDVLAEAHGKLVVDATRLLDANKAAAETIEKLNAALLVRMTARGAA